MKQRSLALLLLLAGCSAQGASTDIVVSSADGSATLTIPAGALPSGTSPDDISIAREDVRIQNFAGAASLWSLSPDGLQLQSPASLRMQVPVREGELFAIDHFSAGSVESLRTSLTAPSDGKRDELIASVEHFSDVAVFVFPESSEASQRLQADWTPAATDLAVEESTMPVLRLTPPAEISMQYSYTDRDGSQVEVVTQYRSTSWQYEGEWRPTGDVGPSIAFVEPQTTEAPYADVSHEFHCISPGEFEISLLANTAMQGTRTLTYADAHTEDFLAEALAFVHPKSGASCTESGLHECADPMAGCPDPAADCGGIGAAELEGCSGYGLADILDYRVSSCDDGMTIELTLAEPLEIVDDMAPGSFAGQLQLKLHLGGLADEDGLVLRALTEDGHPFDLSITGSSVNTGNSVGVDDEGRLLLHISQASIDAYALPVETMYLSSFFKLDTNGSAHRRDETQLSAYACP